MANEKFTQLPEVGSALFTDIICAVQAGVSVQETLGQISDLMLSNTIANYAGNPNGHVAGQTFQLCWDTANDILYTCTHTGSATTAVWEPSSGISSFPISMSLGGTGANITPVANSIVYSGASNMTLLAPANSGLLASTSAGVPVWKGPLTNGQVVIGSTGATPAAATLTAGTNISITNAAGSITIASTGLAGFSWTTVTGTTQLMVANNGYIANNAGLVTLTLPATSAVGDEIDIIGKGAGGWLVQCGAGQTIVLGSSTTSAAGSIASTQAKDCFYMICTVANLEWTIASGPQSAGFTVL